MKKLIFFLLSFQLSVISYQYSLGQYWKVEESGTKVNLRSVYFTDAKHGWAVGDSGVILNYNGQNWSRQSSGTKLRLNSVGFSDSIHGWAVGDSGCILKWNGINWIKQKQIDTKSLGFLNVIDSANVFAGGNNIFLKYENNIWSEDKLKFQSNYLLYTMGFANKNSGFAAGQPFPGPFGFTGGYIFEHSKSGWSYYTSQSRCINLFMLDSIQGHTASINSTVNSHFQETSKVIYFNNKVWDITGQNVHHLFFTDLLHGWAIGTNGIILGYNGISWDAQQSGVNDGLNSLFFINKNDGWVVGNNGTILHTTSGGVKKYIAGGTVVYDNVYNTKMKNTKLYFQNNLNKSIDSTVTDVNGNYSINLENGTYNLKIKPSSTWGGADPTDALIIEKFYSKLYFFNDGTKYLAADVNADGKRNPLDALNIIERYLKIQDSFPGGIDWVCYNNTLSINGGDKINNIIVLCTGDVNGSYNPK